MKKQIHILQIVGYVAGGGVESTVLNYCRRLGAEDFRFDFVVDGRPSAYFLREAKACGGQVYAVTPYKKNIFQNMRDIYRIVKFGNYDIVHSHLNTMAGFSLAAARLAGARIRILHNHATADLGEGGKTLMKWILRPLSRIFATHYCACSANAARWMYGKRGAEKCRVIPSAIDFSKFSYRADVRKKKRAALGWEKKLIIGHVGRLTYAKNHAFLLSVFAEIRKRNGDAVLLLAGDGEKKEEILRRIRDMRLEGSVKLLGVREDVPDWLQAMDAFVFPSWYEGLGMAAVEAQASGLPVLVSENVPEEALFSPLACRMEIAKGAASWAETVISLAEKNAGGRRPVFCGAYDLAENAARLAAYYKNLCACAGERGKP